VKCIFALILVLIIFKHPKKIVLICVLGIVCQKSGRYPKKDWETLSLDRFSAACDHAGMKISIEKTKVLCRSRNLSQYALQVKAHALQQVKEF